MKWISVKEESKPELGQEILAYFQDVAEFVTCKSIVQFPGYFPPKCTHWLPIPIIEDEK